MWRAIGLIGLLAAVLLAGGCWLFTTPDTPPPAATPPELSTITFEQVDWYEADGTSVQANSLWCLMSWTYAPDPSTTYYLNVRAALPAGSQDAWVIRNLPLFPATDGTASPRREAAYINLADLGLLLDTPAELVIGIDVSELSVSISVGAAALNEYEASPSETFAVGASEHRASGLEDESPLPGPFSDPGEPARIDVDGVPIAVNAARDVRSVQELSLIHI